MLGRSVMGRGDPARIDGGIAFIDTHVRPVVDRLPGSYGLGMWVNRETGRFVVTTLWADEASLIASDEQLSPLRAEGLAKLGAAEARIEILEPALMFQTRRNEPGDWNRAVMVRHPLDRLEANLAEFSRDVLPQIRQLPGVTTVGLLVNRGTGLTVLSVTYDSQENLIASRGPADQLRARTLSRLGGELLQIDEMQVAIVGIRPPVDLPAQGKPVEFPANART